MKWFKHNVEERTTTASAIIINEYGMAGYGCWCMLMETVACYSDLGEGTYALPVKQWAQILRMKCGKFLEFCGLLEKLGLIETEVFEAGDHTARGKSKKIFDLSLEHSKNIFRTFFKDFKNILKISVSKLLNFKETGFQNKIKNKKENNININSSSVCSSISNNINDNNISSICSSTIISSARDSAIIEDKEEVQPEPEPEYEPESVPTFAAELGQEWIAVEEPEPVDYYYQEPVYEPEPEPELTTPAVPELQVVTTTVTTTENNFGYNVKEEEDMDYEKLERQCIQEESSFTEEPEEGLVMPRAPEKTLIPANFRVSEKTRLFAQQHGYDADESVRMFVQYATNRGFKCYDWEALFKRAIVENWECLSKKSSNVRIENQTAPASDAQGAWNKIAYAIETYGPSNSVVFDDPKIHVAIEASGGWPKVANTPRDLFGFLKKNFTQLYGSLLVPEKGKFPPYLAGNTELQNRGDIRFRIDPPYLVGDKEKAAEILGDAWQKLNAMRLAANETNTRRAPSEKIRERIAQCKANVKALNKKAEEEREKNRKQFAASNHDLNEYRTDFLDINAINAAIRERRKTNTRANNTNGTSKPRDITSIINSIAQKMKM